MNGVNKVILIGNVGKDPEARELPNGGKVVNLTLATSASWKDKQSGEKVEKTEWHRVVFFNKLADIVSQYVHKGTKLYVEGELQTRKWEDKEGNDRYTTEIMGRNMQMLSGKGDTSNSPDNSGSDPTGSPDPQNDFDDDVPF